MATIKSDAKHSPYHHKLTPLERRTAWELNARDIIFIACYLSHVAKYTIGTHNCVQATSRKILRNAKKSWDQKEERRKIRLGCWWGRGKPRG